LGRGRGKKASEMWCSQNWPRALQKPEGRGESSSSVRARESTPSMWSLEQLQKREESKTDSGGTKKKETCSTAHGVEKQKEEGGQDKSSVQNSRIPTKREGEGPHKKDGHDRNEREETFHQDSTSKKSGEGDAASQSTEEDRSPTKRRRGGKEANFHQAKGD